MREIQPYKTEAGLMKSLDNGGRFFNLFTKAGDERITRAELATAAGVFGDMPKATLFFEMSQKGLPKQAIVRAMKSLESEALADLRKHKALDVPPSLVDQQGNAGACAIVEGFPRFLKNRSQFTGMIMIPVMAGSVTSFMMMPIYEKFDVYEVFDDRHMQKRCCVLASTRGVKFTAGKPVRLGGILRKLEAETGKPKPEHNFYLEACFYTRLSEIR